MLPCKHGSWESCAMYKIHQGLALGFGSYCKSYGGLHFFLRVLWAECNVNSTQVKYVCMACLKFHPTVPPKHPFKP